MVSLTCFGDGAMVKVLAFQRDFDIFTVKILSHFEATLLYINAAHGALNMYCFAL